MERTSGNKERRKSPRFDTDWPLEYRTTDALDAYGGIAVNGNDVGLCIHSIRDMPVGTRLNIVVLYQKEFQLTCFEVLADIIWKDLCLKENWKGYQYGLEFVQIEAENLRKIKKLFSSPVRYRGES